MIAHLLGTVASSILLAGFDYTPFVTYGAYFETPQDAIRGATPIQGLLNGPVKDTSVFKFDTASLKITSADQAVAFSNPSSEWAFGTGDWTIEFWIRGSLPAATCVFSGHFRGASSQRCWRIEAVPASRQIRCLTSVDGTATITAAFTFSSTGVQNTFYDNSTWHHIAAVRNGATVTIYVDGVAGATTGNLSTNSLNHTSVNYPTIGAIPNLNDPGLAFIGNYDEYRVTKGLARYTAGFTPPTTRFGRTVTDDPNIANVLILMGFETASWGVTQYGSVGSPTLTYFSSSVAPQVGNEGVEILSATQNMITAAANAAYDLGSGDFTVEGYISGTGNVGGPIFGPFDEITNGRGWEIFKNGSVEYQFRWTTDGSNTTLNTIQICTQAEMGTSRVLRHFAVTRAGSTIRTYLDGVLKTSGTITGSIFAVASTPVAFGFGARRNAGSIINNSPQATTKAFRITTGYARYIGSSFTPPSQASFKTIA